MTLGASVSTLFSTKEDDEEDPWHVPLILVFLTAASVNALYMIPRLVNLFSAIISTRFFTNDPSSEAGKVLRGQEPHVTIQICTYNEGRIVEETIACACSAHWPLHKLSIQVLDDSTDTTSIQIVSSAVANWNERGVNISRCTRSSRIGYKAGNLNYHFDSVKSEYIAYLDADHRTDPDFLRRTIPFFFDENGNSKHEIGMVQAPWDYYNMDQNVLTRCDALGLDIHHVIEQTGRAAAFGCFGFNGSGGVWRKAAIKSAGGWSWLSITEDLALSYQAFMNGYKFVYVRDIPQVLEVPGNFLAYIQQKHRWTKGFFQVLRQSYWNVLFSPKIRAPLKLVAFCHLTGAIQYTALTFSIFLYPFLVHHGIDGPFVKAAALYPALEPMLSGLVACYAKHPGQKGRIRSFLSRTKRVVMILPFIALSVGMSLFQTKALLEGLFSRDATFLTTPKEGVSTKEQTKNNPLKSANKVKRDSLDDIIAVAGLTLGVHQMIFIMAYEVYFPWNDVFEVSFRLLNILLCFSFFWVNSSFLMEKYKYTRAHLMACLVRLSVRVLRSLASKVAAMDQHSSTLMSWWNVYFLSKLYFQFRGLLNLSAWWNLLLLVWLRVPVSTVRASRKDLLQHVLVTAKNTVDIVLGFLLLWHDSWFPPLSVVVQFWLNPDTRPTGDAFSIYVQDNLSFPVIAVVAIIGWFVMTVRKHRIGMTPVVIALLCLVCVGNFVQSILVPINKSSITEHLDKFQKSEALKRVQFPSKPGAPVDIILLHVCSLAWDDLDAVEKKGNDFFDWFDYMFDDFNTVTAYSGPSMMRLLRSSCGQQIHGDLYNEAPKECYIMDVLRQLGYEVSTAMDHDGIYEDFAESAVDKGHAAALVRPEGLPVEQISFDGSELSDPEAVFDSWLATRNASNAERAAVYFNTLVLHSGSHWKDQEGWWKNDPMKEYADRLDRIFRLVYAIGDKVKKSGRSAAILVVPEHGAAVRGTNIQISQLRDIPLPRIVKSFFGVRFVGPAFPEHPASTVHIGDSVSYMAMAEVIANAVKDPARAAGNLPHNRLTRTPFIAENGEGAGTVIHQDGNYLLQTKDGGWMALNSADLAPADRHKE